jgi:acyl-CoA synthetase (AMP-forming)/AMP-acid ligase II
VIAVLVSTAIDETLLEIALAKLGLTPLLLSVNNSPAAVAHLITVTKATHLIYSPRYEKTAEIAREELARKDIGVEIVQDTRFPLWGPGGVDDAKISRFPARLTPDEEASRTAVILHSSGSVSRERESSGWRMGLTE